MFRVLLVRLVLFCVPFAVWFGWRWWARRQGLAHPDTPWAWLIAAGAILAALSLLATGVLQGDNRGKTYVPAETSTDGRVGPAHFQ
jgi:O-antigen/teichoic acid export membrane protein